MDKKYKKRRIEIKKSRIRGAGLGVFAKRFIPNKTILGYYKGRSYFPKNMKSKDWDLLDNSDYVMAIYDSDGDIYKYIDSSGVNKKYSNWTRNINGIKKKSQEKKQNVRFIQKRTRVAIETIKDIPIGTELIIDYGDEYLW